MKTYAVHVQFNAVTVEVRARNAREAKKKARAKIAKKRADRLIDTHNFFADGRDW